MYSEEYKIIKAFIDWCEATERTEWMGYYNASERVLAHYFEEMEKRNDSSNVD